MPRLHCILGCIVVLFLLVHQAPSQSIAGLLGTYAMTHKGSISVTDSSFSGVALDPSTGTLLIADDDARSIYEVATSGELVGSFDLYGFDDIEGIACQAGRYVLVVEEKRGNVLRMQLPEERSGLIERANCDILYIEENPQNSGIEDVAWLPSGKTGYAVKEKDPTKLYHLTFDNSGKPIACNEITTFIWNISQGDAAGMYALADGNLLILSEIRKTIYGVDLQGKILSELAIDMLQPEGITFDERDSTLYVVGEPREMAVFRLKKVQVANSCSRGLPDGRRQHDETTWAHGIAPFNITCQSPQRTGSFDLQGRVVRPSGGTAALPHRMHLPDKK